MSDALVERLARAWWVEAAVYGGAPREWAERAWDDMGGSEPSEERAEAEIVARALLPVVEQEIAAARAEAWERIAQAIESHACNGSPESCDDALAGAPCPYDDAASIARNYRQENADG